MKEFIKRFSGMVKGTISGFDRIVFKGLVLPLMSSSEVMSFCRSRSILNKDYKEWMMTQTSGLIKNAEQYSRETCGRGIEHISSWRIRKEELAHKRQKYEHIEKGLVGVWSCLESASSYRAAYCKKTGYPQLQNYQTRCKHLYFYFDDKDLGFMNIRLQTWFPYHIQVCLNGREWLRRSLEKSGMDFVAKGNKFLHIADHEQAQRLMDKQLDTRFTKLLTGFLPIVFPVMPDILGPYLSYYWTLWQSEWATDLVFDSPDKLNPIMDSLFRHAHMVGTSTRVLRYPDRPLTKADKPYANSSTDVITRVSDFNDGLRIRHWADKNSVKLYNEQNVLRIETTINDPKKFKVFRHRQGQSPDEPKQRLSLRKGVMDTPLRAAISQNINNRFSDDLATLNDKVPAGKYIEDINHHVVKNGRRFRALDPAGKDLELLSAISDPAYRISGLTNKMLRQDFADTSFGTGRTDKQLSGKISRHLRLLRAHGLVRKIPRQNRYQVTLKGVRLLNILNAFWAASTEDLMKIAA
jgi:hypothetical protein